MKTCDAMLVVIGDRWLSEFGARLFDPDDIVRREIATVLAAGKPVIPILEDSGRMHGADQLPPDLASLAVRQYVRLTYRDAHALPGLVDRLITAAPALGVGVREGIEDLAAWHRERVAATALPEGLALLGRAEVADRLRSWLAGSPGTLVLQGQTTDEVAEFAAVVLGPASRAVRVTSRAGWEHAAKIPRSFPAVVVSDDVLVGHNQNQRHVLIAQDAFVRRADGLTLPRVPRDLARDAFLAAGTPPHLADEYAGLARRSQRALMRRLMPSRSRPPWAQDSAIATPLALIGRWPATNAVDHEIIGRVTGHDYPAVDRFLAANATSSDPLVHRSGSRWQLADPFDAWSQLVSRMTGTDLARFADAAAEVLGEVDPVLSLPEGEAFTAGLRDIRRRWSDDLRQGIAEGLARLGDTGAVAGDTGENHASRIVGALLREANDDRTGLLWRSLADVLPLLAEAAPGVFLDAVRAGTRAPDPLLRLIFDDGVAGHHSPHSGLLWALETLAWSADHRSLATLSVARLAEIDPGGRLANRPSNTLASLLTAAPISPIPVEGRSALINQVRKRYPEVGWRLLDDLTRHGGFLAHPARPRVRQDWASAESAAPDGLTAYGAALLDAIEADLITDPRRWADYLPRVARFPESWRERLLGALENASLSPLHQHELGELWTQVTTILNRAIDGDAEPKHRTPAEVERLTLFAKRIEPVADPTRHAWLFSWHPALPGVDRTDHEAHHAAVDARRQEVVAEVFDHQGFEGLARLAEASTRGDSVGWALARVTGDAAREEVFNVLGSELAEGWVRCRARVGGAEWCAEVVDSVPDDVSRRVAFLLAVPVDWAYERVAAESEETRQRFWEITPAYPFPTGAVEGYLAKILGACRAGAAIDGLVMVLHDHNSSWRPPVEFVVATFQALVDAPGTARPDISYELERLLAYLRETDCAAREIVRWEVMFAGLFHDWQPQTLLDLISGDASAFVELHQFRYLPNGKLNPDATGFYLTAERMRRVPGHRDDVVDGKFLHGWVSAARELLLQANLRKSGDRSIGALISAGPVGADGAWPAEAIRDVLDLEDADEIRIGFLTGMSNDIGMTTRGVYDGGQQERASAAKYLAWAADVELDWPHTARVLRDHAESLRAQGRHWDREAEDDHDE
ncbi:hypothetical protein V5P93_004358 [Actinokineospora auranticolor]|uniref:Uncharacterized protein n=1 Tax=Actinokineospora auranticolor TaxID=155976 RepID=A0A2S6GTK0_9PSEU|nr:hypothetical protein [Actinokineospora auranticolor]PPK68534.1 hypothetical protein CLV40_105263 [Actinokineospora auranticolor]